MVDNENPDSAYRKQIQDIEWQLNQEFDKRIIVLSGSALGLSMTFIKDIVGSGPMVSGGCLVASWTFLILCLALVLINNYIGIVAYRRVLELIDQGVNPVTPLSNVIKRNNLICVVLFLIGISFLAIFSFRNVG